MADIEITVDGGTSKRLLTAGKYCDKNILVTATGGGAEPEPPDDGKTRLYITVPANSTPDRPPPRNQVPLYIQQTVDRGVTIDWGDGTEPETLPGTGKVNTTHTYEKAGDYVISLDPADGCELGLGGGNTSYSVLGSTRTLTRIYCTMLRRAILGSRGVSKLNNSVFYNCSSLMRCSIQDGVDEIESDCFSNTYSLASLVLPSSLLHIQGRGISNAYGIKDLRVRSVSPPILQYSSSLTLNSDCIIYVPVGSLEAYQTATNWSTYADQMQEEPA